MHYWREQKEKKIVTIVKNMKGQDSYLFTLGVHLIVKEKDTQKRIHSTQCIN